MIRRTRLYLIPILVIFSTACSDKSIPTQAQSIHFESLVGFYNNKKHSKLEQLRLNVLHHTLTPIGVSLQLNANSTFVYNACGQTETGSWELDTFNSLIIIEVDSVDYYNNKQDSLFAKNGPPVFYTYLTILQNGNLLQIDTLKTSPDSENKFQFTRIEFIRDEKIAPRIK